MKKISFALMLLLSINSKSFAQVNNTDKTFELPQNSIARIFFIDLDKGDKIKLELGDLEDIDLITNLDSLLRVLVQDIEPLKDSFTDPLSSKRIDYIPEETGKNKIRLQQFAPKGSSFLADKGTVAAMKLEQDTVNIILKAAGGTPALFRNKTAGTHLYRISFLVNNLENLAGYMNGQLQASIIKLQKNATGKWVKGSDGMMHVKKEPSISSNIARGQVGIGDYLNLRISADIQNYKNEFVPSLSFGFSLVTQYNHIKREFSFTGESHFSFAKDDKGKLQSFRNSFITIGYSQNNTLKEKAGIGFAPAFSLGYLVRRRGDLYDKNTFRLGFAKVMMFGGRVKLEPVIYFNNFFKDVTPGIRLSL